MKILNIDEVKGEKLGESAIRRILVYSKNLMLMYTEAEPGGPPIAHSHPHEQMGTVLKGSLELVLDGEKRIVKEGDAYHVPSKMVHGGRCGESPTQFLEVFSPPREDFVQK